MKKIGKIMYYTRSLQIACAFILLFTSFICSAQKVDFRVEAPGVVEVGETFRVIYKVNTPPETGFDITHISGANLISGPQRGQSTSVSYINGRMTTEIEVSKTFVYRATETGTLTIPQARIQVDGRPFRTREQTIEVVGTAQEKQAAQQQQQQQQGQQGQAHPQQRNLPPHMQQQQQRQQQQQQQQQQQAQTIPNAGDIFTQVNVNKRTAYVGEPIYVSMKLYSKYRLSSLHEHTYPEFSGFYQRDLEVPQSLEHVREIVNGEEYLSLLFKRIVAFPQRSGEIVISPFEVECNVNVPIGRGFWGLQYQQERKKASSRPITINVKPLPSAGKPSNFNGAVGSFTIQASADQTEVMQNDAFTYTVTLRGTGNISLIQPPNIQFPSDFEVYDPKISRNHPTTIHGDRGTIKYEYVIIPRREGTFSIPAVQFSFFDTNSESYKTASASDVQIHVKRSSQQTAQGVTFTPQKEELTYFDEDIRHIKTTSLTVSKKDHSFFGTAKHYAWYYTPAIFLILFAIIRRKQIKENQDIARVRIRKANKESKKRLKIAGKCLQNGEHEQYFDEVAKALWGYIADKYTIPLANLNKDSIRVFLTQKNVTNEQITELIAIIEQCEIARYTPQADIAGKEKLYSRAAAIIHYFEQTVK